MNRPGPLPESPWIGVLMTKENVVSFQMTGVTYEHGPNPKKILVSFTDYAKGNDFKVWIEPSTPMNQLTLQQIHDLALAEASGQKVIQG